MVAVPLEQLQLLECHDMALVSREDLLAESIWSTQLGTHRPGLSTTKPGASAPGICLLSRGAFPRGSGAAVRSVDLFQIRFLWLLGGAAGASTWGQLSSGTFRLVRVTWDGAIAMERVCLFQGKTRQEHQ